MSDTKRTVNDMIGFWSDVEQHLIGNAEDEISKLNDKGGVFRDFVTLGDVIAAIDGIAVETEDELDDIVFMVAHGVVDEIDNFSEFEEAMRDTDEFAFNGVDARDRVAMEEAVVRVLHSDLVNAIAKYQGAFDHFFTTLQFAKKVFGYGMQLSWEKPSRADEVINQIENDSSLYDDPKRLRKLIKSALNE